MTLSKLTLVDTRLLTWQHILEVRKDRELHWKLRRLRRVFEDDYAGKPPSFVQDDIERRIFEHNKAATSNGLGLRDGAISSFLGKAKWEAVAAAGGAFLGQEPVTTLLAAGPLAFSFGSAFLEYRREKRNLELLAGNDPISYLIEVGPKPN